MHSMKILMVAATNLELNTILEHLNINNCSPDYNNFIYKRLNIDFVVTGIGLVFTSYQVAKSISNKNYDLIIEIGIAGSFNKNLQIGEIVNVTQEEFSDLGIESPAEFKTIFESNFINNNTFPFSDGKLISKEFDNELIKQIKQVKSISSNTAHGNALTINNLMNKFNPDIESMEGAAFFYVCLMEKVNFIEIRAISNYVEPRNVSNWNIPLAIKNLSGFIVMLLEDLGNKVLNS